MRAAARYSIAFVSVGMALLVTVALGELLAPMRLFFLWVAVLIAALAGGTAQGLLATALALAGAIWMLFPPGRFAVSGMEDVLRLTLFAAFASGISIAVGRTKRLTEHTEFINRASELLSSTLASQAAMRNLARLCVPALGDACAIYLGEERVVVEPPGAELPEDAVAAPMVARGRTLGKLVLASREPNVPLIEELARRAAIAIDNARLFEKAEEANRAKDEFLATLSHELRTPLTAIAGWAHMLQAGIDDEATRRLAIDTIIHSADLQRELIEDLLDVSRVMAGTLHLELSEVDLAKVVQETLVAARPAAEAKGITLSCTGTDAASPVVVRGDERRLRQVVWNLVSNAVKFTDRGGSAMVRLSVSGSVARVEVTDTGSGIDPAFLPHVWDRFSQADGSTSRAHGGLGLGLSVVRHLVELHGGTVLAESEGLGRGATFRVELPLAGAAADSAGQ